MAALLNAILASATAYTSIVLTTDNTTTLARTSSTPGANLSAAASTATQLIVSTVTTSVVDDLTTANLTSGTSAAAALSTLHDDGFSTADARTASTSRITSSTDDGTIGTTARVESATSSSSPGWSLEAVGRPPPPEGATDDDGGDLLTTRADVGRLYYGVFGVVVTSLFGLFGVVLVFRKAADWCCPLPNAVDDESGRIRHLAIDRCALCCWQAPGRSPNEYDYIYKPLGNATGNGNRRLDDEYETTFVGVSVPLLHEISVV